MRELKELRTELDAIDREMTALLERRIGTAREVAVWKQAHGLPVLDAKREAEVLATRRALLKDPSLGPACDRFYRELMALCRAAEEEVTAGA